jgi:GxxExxY protein
MNDNYKFSDITNLIIKSFYRVYNQLGYGFLEKVYEKAMIIELAKHNLIIENQKNIKVFYEGSEVGDYYADFVINDSVIVELKAVEETSPKHEVQLVNYLKATKIEVGLLLNFGAEPQILRRVFSNAWHSESI